MRDVLGPNTILGYCTNVHAGAGYAQMLANLRRFAPSVKERVSAHEPMGIGLWFSAKAAYEAKFEDRGHKLAALRQWLDQQGLLPYTLNGFPDGDFHEPVVKHRVYLPDWTGLRAGSAIMLAIVLADLDQGRLGEGSISTLPIGWPGKPCPPVDISVAAQKMAVVIDNLDRISGSCGVLVHLDLEPEPGCILHQADDVVRFFIEHLLPAAASKNLSEDVVRQHLRVCHDVCHSAVIFEDQATALATYRAAGIKVGKVQISSAVRVPFDEMSGSERQEAFAQLRGFDEPRYLHQTMIRTDDGRLTFFEDLPLALQEVERGKRELRGEWRVHFHVPVFLEKFGLIQTTQSDIAACLRAIQPEDQVHHFEVETYAWNVLPRELQAPDLADGIARELLWIKDQAAAGVFR